MFFVAQGARTKYLYTTILKIFLKKFLLSDKNGHKLMGPYETILVQLQNEIGKPVEMLGRKATGLRAAKPPTIAELPHGMRHVYVMYMSESMQPCTAAL